MVKLVEFIDDEKMPNELSDVNLIDDLEVYMNNDPQFYRKVLYPTVSDLQHRVKSGQPCKETCFLPAVKQGAKSYCKKFNIPTDANEIFADEELKNLAIKIFHNEQNNFNSENN
jgi:hypothetical protein